MSDQPENAIATHGLGKTYGRGTKAKRALDGVDLAIPRGSLFGLLGPNGAGKSTFINILAGLVNKTEGRADIWGWDIDRHSRQARAAIGVVPQELNIDPFFTPRELLEMQAGLYGVPPAERRSDAILAALGLGDKAKAYTRTLSGGMRRRLLVAKAMVHNPPVLILDEPTAGVDIELRQQLWAYVRDLNRAGTTVVLTTHYLEEAEEMCDTIAIINHGRVIACEATSQLLRRIDAKEMIVEVAEGLEAVPAPLADLGAELVDPHHVRLRYQRAHLAMDAILAAVSDSRLTVRDLTTAESDLEDVFLQLTRADRPAA